MTFIVDLITKILGGIFMFLVLTWWGLVFLVIFYWVWRGVVFLLQ